MDIHYKTRKLQKVCTNASTARKTYGAEMAIKIHQRIDELHAIESVELMIKYRIGRCHALTGDRMNQYALDLVHPYRMIFIVIDNDIQIAEIQEIVDYH